MQYKEFFGIHGALPLAFTDRILANYDAEEDIISFFNCIFADFVKNKEKEYYHIVHSYISLFKTRKKQECHILKAFPIDIKYNFLGVAKTGEFLIGKKSFCFVGSSKIHLHRLGSVRLR